MTAREQPPDGRPYVHRTATIADSARIDPSAWIGPRVRIGANSTIGPNCVIGGLGFGYAFRDGAWERKSHDFGVIIGAGVDVGANTVIDRGSWRDTYVGDGTKIDSLCFLAHNVHVGLLCMIVAHAELSGSVTLRNRVWVGASACVRERLTVGNDALIGMGSVVVSDVPAGVTVGGNPAGLLRHRGSEVYFDA